jgi:hypothetical protein
MAFFQFFISQVSKWIAFVALGVGAGANTVGADVEDFPNKGVKVSTWIEFVALGVKTGDNTVGAVVEAVFNTGVQVSKIIGFIVSSACTGVESGVNGTIVSASLSTLQESSNSSFRAFSRGCN